MTHPTTPASDADLLAEVVDLVGELGQTLEWIQMGGADVLPVEAPLGRDERAALLERPPRVARPMPASRPPQAMGGPPGQAHPPPSQPSGPSRQPSLGNWGQFLQKSPPAHVVGALDRAATLDAVRSELGDCQRCGLCRGRRNIVFGVGSETADLMVIGEGPGANEDRVGEPFVGKAGQMLDRMLANVLGLERSQVYIANVVKCRPPGNRNPEAEEVARCRPFLLAQMRVIQPKIVLVLGSVASRAVFGTSAGITRLRGSWRDLEYPGGRARAMPTFHPAYLLRQPGEKRKTFEDLKAVKAALAQPA